ncbi:MAG: hypothetical protein ACOVQ5_01600 [Flavobacteriales bacterium]|jgi:hypothetical protein
MAYLLKVLTWWLASIVKFLFTPFVMMGNPGGYHWSYLEIILITSSGAALGCFIFYHFGEVIFSKWPFQSKNKKVFSPMKRRIIRLKMKYGIYGLMMISALVSVPVSSLLCARFYKHDPTALSKLILGFSIWSVALTSLAYSFRLLGFEF